jgi:asparagine synthase (glutamine-hydrolysing)
MCGVAGIYRPGAGRIDAERLHAMTGSIAHRGPDDTGQFLAAGIALAHNRLSILDLSPRAAQPMASSDGRYVLSYNGEIYNFRELRSQLEAEGARFRSTGDTEVLLTHLEMRGVASTVRVLDGDWAFALWDKVGRELVLARDRHGVKPMYYLERAGEIRFASELKSLVDRDTEPDAATVNAMLIGYSGTWSQATAFAEIEAVPAGHWLSFTDGCAPSVHRYFSLTEFVDTDLMHRLQSASRGDIVAHTRRALTGGVRSRMVSDAPLACLLSGGLDSSVIAALAREHTPNLQLYHADVDGDSERAAAEGVARHLGLPLHVVRVTDEDFMNSVAAVTYANDIPLTYHLNSVPFYKVAELAAEDGVKVLLTGEGSDEYFLGYPEYAQAAVREAVRRAKDRLRQLAAGVSRKATNLVWPSTADTWADHLAHLVSRFETQLVAEEVTQAYRSSTGEDRVPRAHLQTMTLALDHLLSLLHRNDRLGMAWSLESRFPFLANDVARFAVNLPGRYKLRPTTRVHDAKHPFVVDKWCVRAVGSQLLPAEFAQRQKNGFPVSVYQRLTIDPEFFADGFVAQHFRLPEAVLARLGQAPREWQMRLLLVDVWGRMFFAGETTGDVTLRLQKHTVRHVA